MSRSPKFTSDYSYDFGLIGLVSSAKEYTLAWHFNHISFLHFTKAEDIHIDFKDNSKILISNFLFESEFMRVFLLRNKLLSSNSKVNRYLIPELARFDYLVRFEAEIDEPTLEDLLMMARSIPVVDYAMTVEVKDIKSKENLLF